VANQVTPNPHVRSRPKPWQLIRNTLRIEILSGRKKKLKEINLLLQQLQLPLRRKKVLKMKMKMNLSKKYL
jgi:hypothetical protein